MKTAWAKFSIIAALLLTGCAATRYPVYDTTELAKMGDTAFAVDTIPNEKSVKRFDELDYAQTRITPTNLTIRHRLLWAAIDHKQGLRFRNADEARRQFDTMERGGFWSEGFSYFEYVRGPMLWYSRVTGDTAVSRAELDAIWNNYARLADPRGDLPLPEVAEGLGLPPRFEREVRTPSYYVRRWFSGDTVTAYLLVAKSTRVHPALNLHHRLEAGYFALWIRGRYVVRCAPYTGWSSSSPAREGGFYDQLPKGAVKPQAWRVDPPAITVEARAHGFRFTWKGAGRPATRSISFSDTSVTVSDTWGWWGSKTRSWRL